MANQDLIQTQLANINTVAEFLELQNPSITYLIESITYNPLSQKVIIHLGKLLKRESDQIKRETVPLDLNAEEALERLSRHYRQSYPQFLECFNQWKPKRKELITSLNTSAKQIDLNFSLVSALRIMTSTADIFGTLRLFRHQMPSWSILAFENASIIGLFGLFLEQQQTKEYYLEIEKIITEDQEMFQELKKWFKQSEELDRAVRTFFPYGIDKDIVKVIDKAPTMTDKYYKLLASILVSNVKNDVNLFRNRTFLDKAENFATSEAGIQWFNKVILEDDPFVNDCLKIGLTNEIYPEILVGTSAFLVQKASFKLLLSLITIYSSVKNLWKDRKSKDSVALRQLAKQAEKELDKIKRVLELLQPSGYDIGDALQ